MQHFGAAALDALPQRWIGGRPARGRIAVVILLAGLPREGVLARVGAELDLLERSAC